MAKLRSRRLNISAVNFSGGTWAYTLGTAVSPFYSYWGKTPADNTPVAEFSFATHGNAQQFGSKIIGIGIPMLVGAADLDAPITATLTEVNTYRATPVPAQTFTVNVDVDTITLASSPLSLGQWVTVASSTLLPSGLLASTNYFVGNIDPNNNRRCQLFTTLAGAKLGSSPVNITTAGTGTHTITASAIDGINIPITLEGAQVTASAIPRLLKANIVTPVYDSNDYTGLPVDYHLSVTTNCATGTDLRYINGARVFYEDTL